MQTGCSHACSPLKKGLRDSSRTYLPTFYCREAYAVRTAYVPLRTLVIVAQPKHGGSETCLTYAIQSFGLVSLLSWLNLSVTPFTQETLQST